ncbi:MAG: hypothetical protein JJ974_01050 [Phycisphaerales bacterium]|nr:hypothetical protein [Phycisphaerales bacterium]
MMLVIRPARVRFGSDDWDDVLRVAIESLSVEVAEEWDDEGPNLMYADSTRRKTTVRVIQELDGDDLLDPEIGDEATLHVEVDRGNDSDARVVSCTAMVQSVSYSLSGSRSSREIRLIAVSSRGDVEPVNVVGG